MQEQIVQLKQTKLKQTKSITKWTMAQTWEHLLFAHWPISPEAVRPFVPSSLEIDTFNGKAWLGAVSFFMTGVKLKYLPLSYPFHFPEINIRTYVKMNGIPAVFFITLDAADPLVVRIAKRWYRLPYFRANMSFRKEGGERKKGSHFRIESRRKSPRSASETFQGKYRPSSRSFIPRRGTLAHWLMERYVFFCQPIESGDAYMYGGEVHHEPWRLQSAEVDIATNSLIEPYRVSHPENPPLSHYSRGVEALIGPVKLFQLRNG